jgi:hypothetical protein
LPEVGSIPFDRFVVRRAVIVVEFGADMLQSLRKCRTYQVAGDSCIDGIWMCAEDRMESFADQSQCVEGLKIWTEGEDLVDDIVIEGQGVERAHGG